MKLYLNRNTFKKLSSERIILEELPPQTSKKKKKLQSLSNKNSIILEQKLTYRPNGTKSKSQT